MTKKIFNLSMFMDRFCKMIHNSPDFWIKMGNFESRCLRDDMDQLKIEKPIYVTGLARSGSSILLEILSRFDGVVSHRYSDFPPVFTLYWWNFFLKWVIFKKIEPAERAHQDGIFVTPDSPEAMEEVFWMAFFKDVHNIEVSNVIDGNTSNLDFETFYKDHILKLLLTRNGNRYLAKANYNITRLEYILKIFPDARFIIPMRDPVDQIKSLIKQHLLFCKGQEEEPRATSYLKNIGHFEFGLDFRPINCGDTHQNLNIKNMLQGNKYITGWARYWNQIYGYIGNRLMENEALKKAAMIVEYETFCKSPVKIIELMRKHCDLPEDKALLLEYETKIKPPDYYKMEFSQKDLEIIKNETQKTLQLFEGLRLTEDLR